MTNPLIKLTDRLPPCDADHACIIVFADGYESPTDGMTVNLYAEKTPQLARGWKEIGPEGWNESMPNSKTDWEHDGDIDAIAAHLFDCAGSWDPKARLIGNARAEDLVMLAQAFMQMRRALDECPWPREVWPNTIEETGKAMREALGDLTTTAISGVLMRHGWEQAKARLDESLT